MSEQSFTQRPPLRVLFLCTRNAARSQMAEALMRRKVQRVAAGRFVAGSAGAAPADEVHPLALEVLREFGIEWGDRSPKSIDSVCDQPWDLVITLCDSAKETCPAVPGQPAFAHWGIDDPSEVFGDEASRHRAFHDALTFIGRRIDLLLALPVERLERRALEERVRRIADEVPRPTATHTDGA